MKSYTYRIKFIPTGEYYYGVRYAKDCDPSELWKTYFTSSLIVRNLIRQYGKELFHVEIRKIFDTPDKAIAWESKVNKYTRKWPNYLNRTDAKSIGNEFGKKGGLIGGHEAYERQVGIHSPEWAPNKSKYGKIGGQASVDKQVGLHDPTKPWLNSPSKMLNMRNGHLKGGQKTGSMPWWNNGITDTKSPTCPGQGWSPGMISRGHYWNNGTEQKICFECPGEGWVSGGIGKTVTGRIWWTNGIDQRMEFSSPGPEWARGKLPGSSNWWTNGVIQLRQKEYPGEGWSKGMLKKSFI